jgi:hypothetical protein
MRYPIHASPVPAIRRSRFRSLPSWLALLLAGCATVPAPEYPRDHPANPEASAAPMSSTAAVLSTYRAAGARPGPGQPGASDGPANESGEQGHSHEHQH